MIPPGGIGRPTLRPCPARAPVDWPPMDPRDHPPRSPTAPSAPPAARPSRPNGSGSSPDATTWPSSSSTARLRQRRRSVCSDRRRRHPAASRPSTWRGGSRDSRGSRWRTSRPGDHRGRRGRHPVTISPPGHGDLVGWLDALEAWRSVRIGRGPVSVPFAHASEAEMARILDFYEVRWEYEPHTFPILWNLDGEVVESFSPDFYLPDLDLYLEMTTLRQKLVRKKNRKLRRLRELYPDLSVKLFYARDFRALMLKYGKLALVDGLSGTSGQVASPYGHVRAERCARRCRCRRRRALRRRRSPGAVAGRATPRDRRRRPLTRRTKGRRSAMSDVVDLHADIGEVLLTEEEIQAKVARARRADQRRLRRSAADPRVGAQGLAAVHGRPDAGDRPARSGSTSWRSPRTAARATESSGLVRILKDLSASIEGEDVLIVEDIIDTGLTLNYLAPLPARQEPRVAPDLHPARQAGPPPRRHPGRLHRVHDPGPVRRRLRPRLRRALPQPALRGRPAPRGLQRGPQGDAMTMHRRPSVAAAAGRARRRCHRRRLRPAVVAGRRRRRASRASRQRPSRAAGSSSSSRRSRRSRSSRCRTPPATARSRSIAGVSYALLAVVGLDRLRLSGSSSWSWRRLRIRRAVQVFTNGPGLWLAGLGLGHPRRAAYDMTREPAYR